MYVRMKECGSNFVSFELDQPIALPLKIESYSIDEKILWLAPLIPSWLTTQGLASELMGNLIAGNTLSASIVNLIGKKQANIDKVLGIAKKLLTQVERKRFYQSEEYISKHTVKNRDIYKLGSVHLYLTRRCNFKCFYCYMDAGEPLPDELTTDLWFQFLSKLSGYVSNIPITISGGEPLLHHDWFVIAKHAQQLGYNTMLLTNASMIRNVAIAKQICQVFSRIQVSLDGINIKTFDLIRGSGAFEHTMCGIDLLYEAGAHIELAVTVLPENIDDIEKNLVSWLKKFEGGRVHIRLAPRIDFVGRAESLDCSYIDFSRTSWFRIQKILTTLQNEGFVVVDPEPVSLRKCTCGIGTGLTIDSDGTIYPCAEPYYYIGKFPNDSLDEILHKLKRLFYLCSLEKSSQCRLCNLRYVCGGGCRIKHHAKTGSFNIPDCSSTFKKDILRELSCSV